MKNSKYQVGENYEEFDIVSWKNQNGKMMIGQVIKIYKIYILITSLIVKCGVDYYEIYPRETQIVKGI